MSGGPQPNAEQSARAGFLLAAQPQPKGWLSLRSPRSLWSLPALAEEDTPKSAQRAALGAWRKMETAPAVQRTLDQILGS